MAIPSAITHKIMGINIFPYTLLCYKICRNNIFFSLEEAHSSERKLGLSPKQYFCYREDYLLQWNKQNEKPTSTSVTLLGFIILHKATCWGDLGFWPCAGTNSYHNGFGVCYGYSCVHFSTAESCNHPVVVVSSICGVCIVCIIVDRCEQCVSFGVCWERGS